MWIEYDDDSTAATCSIHCAAVDFAVSIGKSPRAVKVGDYNTKELIDAETACWTIGGDVQGVMTSRPKWAFATKADCEKFAGDHGARIASFDDAMKAAYEDMYTDTKMIRNKRKAMKTHQQQKEGTQQSK
jgi:copper chaperone NosL